MPAEDDLEEIPGQAEWCVHGEITRWVDDEPQPGIVETRLTDRFGRDWLFISKFYDVAENDLSPGSSYPRPGHLRCIVLSQRRDETGREIVEIDTDDHPRGQESVDGASRFEVFADQLHASHDWQRMYNVRLTALK